MLQILIFAFGIVLLPVLLAKIFNLQLTDTSWRLIGVGVLISMAAIIAIRFLPSYGRGENFVEHAMGGGVPSAIMLAALLATRNQKFTWLQELVLLFFFVSGTGALNELLEFVGDELTTFQFSLDRFDTWYDILANSLGALTGWLVLRAANTIKQTE